jgi:hypothetical protein
MIYNRIEVVTLTFDQLASDENKRLELKKALNLYGENGWRPVQFQQVGQSMLIFMAKEGA